MFKIKKKKKMSINKVCRACLTERGHLREIFTTKIPKMLETIATVTVTEGDGLPANICVTCFHLIAKFYTFRKKIERSDRFLRNQCQKPDKDILDLALCEAQIDSNRQEAMHSIEPESDDRRDNVDNNNEGNSYESVPLNGTINNDGPKECKESAGQFIEALIRNDSGKCASEPTQGTQEIAVCSSAARLFVEGPPPLVPLEPQVKKGEGAAKAHADKSSTSHLPVNTPPLIPIKPIVDAESILTIIKPPVELKLFCPACEKDFLTIEALKQHKLNDCRLNSLQCNICKKEYREKKKLIGHLKGHMISKDYVCTICDKRYPNPSTFKVHMRTHTGERPFKCQICGKGFIRWAGVTGHMKTHQALKKYKCPTCGKGFKVQSNLQRHKVLHSGILPYCCNYCGRMFSQSDNLQLHIKTYHTNERPYLCNECGKGFVSSTRLNRHMWVHTGYKPYLCKSCPKAYSNFSDLKNHERTHSGSASVNDKPYMCEVCDMRFYHPCRLKKHMKIHDRSYACLMCPKAFSSSRLLQKHVNTDHSTTESSDVPFVQEVVIDNSQEFVKCESC